MTKEELNCLKELASSLTPGSTWVEIGTWKGRSFAAVAESIPDGCELWAIDTWLGTPSELTTTHSDASNVYHEWLANLADLQESRPKVKMNYLREHSLEASNQFKEIDVIFLDADHSEEAVFNDLTAWYPKLKSDGIFCGHDLYVWPGVEAALNRFGKEYGKVFGSIWAITPSLS